MSDLVGNPEDRFSHVAAHILDISKISENCQFLQLPKLSVYFMGVFSLS